jgi:glucosylglycerol-phosphate synthase
LPLTPDQVSSFYHITSKEAFWPILHSFKERYNYDPVDWPTFREVNWAFAEAAAAEAAPGAVVWVHDYNLWLVPGYLRKLRPDVRISFFHHTPFPAADMFNVLPWRREIVESLLACDVIGFHIPRYAVNFVHVAQSLLEVDGRSSARTSIPISSGRDRTVGPAGARIGAHQGRRIKISCAPVGVDWDFIEDLAAASEPTREDASAIREELGDCKLILSVGRTDYTKGGVQQLESYERVLQTHPELHGKVRLMHVSVGANRNMAAYEEIQSEIEQMAAASTARFGSFEWQPMALISSRSVQGSDRLLPRADICWITPLADGMNLVCKEYAAPVRMATGFWCCRSLPARRLNCLRRSSPIRSRTARWTWRSSRHLRCRRKNAASAWR